MANPSAVGYHGPSLVPWFTRKHIQRALRDATEAGGRRLREHAEELTPVGEYVDERVPGTLKAGWHHFPPTAVVRVFDRGWSSKVENAVPYAIYVEHGTGIWHEPDPHTPYVIVPKNPDGWLRWIDRHTLQPVFARFVVHPGIKPARMLQKAAILTYAEFGEIVAPHLVAWKERQEHAVVGVPL